MKQIFQGKNARLFYGDQEIKGIGDWKFTTNISWYRKGEHMIYKLFKKYIDREVDKRVIANTEMEFLKSMKKLDVKDNDLIIIEYSDVLPFESGSQLADAIENMFLKFGVKTKGFLIDGGMKMSVSSKKYTGLSYIIDNDKDFLKWIWARLNYLHGESPDSDYMHKLLDVAEQVGFEKDVKDFISNYMERSGE
jgi:hypothetical protein